MSDHLENVINLLFIGSNFKHKKVTRTEKEFETIRETLEGTYFGKLINFQYKFAVKRESLESIIDEFKPQVIHFSGHGNQYVGPLFDGDEFEYNSIDMTEDLANILYKFREHVEMVIFNVCDSANIARQVAKHITFTVGTKTATDDDSAIAFTRGFYEHWLNNDNLRNSVEKGNENYNISLSKKKFKSKKEETYALDSKSLYETTSDTDKSFLDAIKEKSNLISYLIYSNHTYVGLTNYNYFFKKIVQINSDELDKWNNERSPDNIIKTNLSEDWAGNQLISQDLSNLKIKKIILNPKFDNDTEHRIQKIINQYEFSNVKRTLMNKLEEYDCFNRDKRMKNLIIEGLESFLKAEKVKVQLLGFTYYNDDNSIRCDDYDVTFVKKRKNSNLSIRNLKSNETFSSGNNMNIHVMRDFKEHIKNL